MADTLKKLKQAIHPALFGSYDPNQVTVGSVGFKAPGIPANMTLGIGEVSTPEKYYRGGAMGNMGMVPGVTFRIGGLPDSTDERLKSVARFVAHPIRGMKRW